MPFIPIPLDWANDHLELAPELASGLRWKKAPANNKKYMVNQMAGSLGMKGYWKIRIKGKDYRAHRVVWALAHREDPGLGSDLTIDHIDRNKSNNSASNLRLRDAVGQMENTNWRGGKSKYPGVALLPSGRWQAQYYRPGQGAGGKQKYLGTFSSEEQAWNAIKKEAAK